MKFMESMPGTLESVNYILENASNDIIENTTCRHKLKSHQQEVVEAVVSLAMDEAIANIQKEVEECLTAFQDNK